MMSVTKTNFMFTAKNSIIYTADTCPPGYVKDPVKGCIVLQPPSIGNKPSVGTNPPGGSGSGPTICKNRGEIYDPKLKKCVKPSVGGSGPTICKNKGEIYDPKLKKCVKPSGGSDSTSCQNKGEVYDPKLKKCVEKPSGPKSCNGKQVYDSNSKHCVPGPSSCKIGEIFDTKSNKCAPSGCQPNQWKDGSGKCFNLCSQNNMPGYLAGNACKPFAPNQQAPVNSINPNKCNSNQYQDKLGNCLPMCTFNNKPGVIRDGQCKPFSSNLGPNCKNKDEIYSTTVNGCVKAPKPPTPSINGPDNPGNPKPKPKPKPKPVVCPPGQMPSNNPLSVAPCVIDPNYKPNCPTGQIYENGICRKKCPPGQVYENNICKIPQQGPPPPQKPISFVPNNPQSGGCQPGQTCSGSINYQGTNVGAYSYNGNTYIIKDVNGQPRPCLYMPNMNAGGGFPCLDDTSVNFVNGQIVPNTDFETAFGH